MSNLDYKTGRTKPGLSSGGNALGLLLLVVIAIGLLALFSFFGGGTGPIPGEDGAAGDVPAATAPASSDPVATEPVPVPVPVQPAD